MLSESISMLDRTNFGHKYSLCEFHRQREWIKSVGIHCKKDYFVRWQRSMGGFFSPKNKIMICVFNVNRKLYIFISWMHQMDLSAISVRAKAYSVSLQSIFKGIYIVVCIQVHIYFVKTSKISIRIKNQEEKRSR